MWCIVPARTARPKIEEKRCGSESIRPVAGWHVGMKEEGADAVVECAKDMFGATVLLRGIWASEIKKNYAMVRKERTECEIVKLFSIVSLKSKNGTLKLRADIGIKIRQCRERIQFSSQGKSPHIMGVIVKHNKII